MLGERLYPLVAKLGPFPAKITGMLLETETREVLHFIRVPLALKAMVREAEHVLEYTVGEELYGWAASLDPTLGGRALEILLECRERPPTPADLANLPPYIVRYVLGTLLFRFVLSLGVSSPTIITDYLLSKGENEVLRFISSRSMLQAAVDEAKDYLKES